MWSTRDFYQEKNRFLAVEVEACLGQTACATKPTHPQAASMSQSVAQARQDVQRAFDAALSWVEQDAPRSLAETEAGLWTRLLALGRAMTLLFLALSAGRPRPAEYEHDGVRYELLGTRTTEIGTRFGKVAFRRPVGRRAGAARAACDLPVDRELGLTGGFSLGVIMMAARFCAQMAFGAARETFRLVHEWAPSTRSILRMIDAVGEHARPFLEQAPAPEDDGEILVIQVDGRGAPMITEAEIERRRQPHRKRRGTARDARRTRRKERPKKRRTKGKKSKNAKVAIVGVIYTLRTTKDGLEGPIGKRLIATFESHGALFDWLCKEATKRGYGEKETFFLGDGSDHIWRLQEQHFPDAHVCVDWYHVIEKIWSAGECVHREGTQELEQWVKEQAERLRTGAADAVIEELSRMHDETPKTGPGNRGRRERLIKVKKYLEHHQARLRYDELRRRGVDIGTGAVEGAVRNLVAMRLDGPGMRWGRGRSELLLHLRCILLNGQWSAFSAFMAQKARPKLPAQPLPTVTHVARAAA